jgi:multicomponent Na+:H+ antiporter subunit E
MTVRRTTLVQVVTLFGFWVALSGRFEPLFLVTGLATVIVVTAVTRRLTAEALPTDADHVPWRLIPLAVLRGVWFALWMASRILVASVQLAVIALSPTMPLDTCTVRVRTTLRRPLARTTLANSISLVPGTLTVDIDGDEIVVHALSPSQVSDLTSGRLQNKVAAVFLEDPQPPLDPELVEQGDMEHGDMEPGDMGHGDMGHGEIA